MTYSSALAAKQYAAEYIGSKVLGVTVTGFTDYDPGVDGPTDPSPPPDNPDESDIEIYMLARQARTMWEIKTSWKAGNP